MKNFKYLLLAIITLSITITSCSDDDDSLDHDFDLEYVKVLSAELPNEFEFGSTYIVKASVELPNSCYFYYNQYDYIYEGASRLIYAIGHVDEHDTCNEIVTEDTLSFPVTIQQSEPYNFKFYQGKDANGEDIFLTIEVPVI